MDKLHLKLLCFLLFFFSSCSLVLLDNQSEYVQLEHKNIIQTSESGSIDSISVVLLKQPVSDVIISFLSSNINEGQLLSNTLLFTPQNWFINQQLQVQGIDDAVLEEETCSLYEIIIHPIVSNDTIFSGLDIDNLTACNLDNEQIAFIEYQDNHLLYLIEELKEDAYTIELTTIPEQDLSIRIVLNELVPINPALEFRLSEDSGWQEDTITLIFSAKTHILSQTVYVRTVNDIHIGNSGSFFLQHEIETLDIRFQDVILPSREVVFVDIDSPGIIPSELEIDIMEGAINLYEYNIYLTHPIENSFLLEITSNLQDTLFFSVEKDGLLLSEEYESLVNLEFNSFSDYRTPITLSFYASNNTAEFSTLLGLISHRIINSVDMTYTNVLIPKFVAVSIENDDIPIYLLTPNDFSLEEGDSSLVSLGLTAEPLFPVYISFNLPRGIYMEPRNTFVFTRDNWNVLQRVTLSTAGLENTDIGEAVRTFNITSTIQTLDASFLQAEPKPEIRLNIIEDDVPTVVSSVDFLNLRENDVFVYNIDISLNAEPTDPVNIQVEYNTSLLVVTPSAFTFSSSSTEQRSILVRSLDNLDLGLLNSSIRFIVDINSDSQFVGNDLEIPVFIEDNDIPSLSLSYQGASIQTDLIVEESALLTYQISLANKPLAGENIMIRLAPVPDTSGVVQVLLSDSIVSFSTSNWSTPVNIQVMALQDDIAEESRPVIINHVSTILTYLVNEDLTIRVVDSVNAANAGLFFFLSGVTHNPEQVLSLQESSFLEYDIQLASQPFPGQVEVTLFTDDQLVASPRLLQFNENNWSISQRVRVEAVDDDIVEGEHSEAFLLHTFSSTEDTYSLLLPQVLEFDTSDNGEIPSILFSNSLSGPYTPNITDITFNIVEGASQRYFIRLSSEPIDIVRINLLSENLEGGIYLQDCSNLTFIFTSLGSSYLLFEPNSNINSWDVPQFVTISTFEDDNSLSEFCNIQHDIISNDTAYDALSSFTVLASIEDLTSIEYGFVPPTVTMQENLNQQYATSSYSMTFSSLSRTSIQVEMSLDNFSVVPLEVYNGTTWVPISSRPIINISSLSLAYIFSIRIPSDNSVIDYSTFISHHITGGDSELNDIVNLYISWIDASIPGISFSDFNPIFLIEEGDNIMLNLSILSEPLADLNFSISLTSQEQQELSILVNNVDACDLALEICSWFIPSTNWMDLSELVFLADDDAFIESQETIEVEINITSNDLLYNIQSAYVFEITIRSNDIAGILLSQSDVILTEGDPSESITYQMSARPLEQVNILWNVTFLEQIEFFNIASGLYESTLQATVIENDWNINNVLEFQAVDDSVALEFTEMLSIVFTTDSLDLDFNALECTSCLRLDLIDDDIARTNAVKVTANSTVFIVDRFDDMTVSFSDAYYLTSLNLNLGRINFTLFLNAASGDVVENILLISVGNQHICANTNNLIYCTGVGLDGELGNLEQSDVNFTPVIIAGTSVSLSNISALDSGFGFTCAVENSLDTVYCWGQGDWGQTGSATYSNTNAATVIYKDATMELDSIITLDLGYYHACASDTSKSAYCWGKGTEGELGQTTLLNSSLAVQVMADSTSFLQNVQEVVAGGYHSCAIIGAQRNVYCWGRGSSGQLGINSTPSMSQYPTAVLDSGGTLMLSDVFKLSLGEEHSCAIVGTQRNIYCWGNGANGRLGNNLTTDSILPVQAMTPMGVMFSDLALGVEHTCAISDLNIPYCWGNGYSFLEQKDFVITDEEILIPQRLEGF